MSASENSRPASDEYNYDYTEKSECAKHKPMKYLVPDAFNNPAFNNDRQFIRFESNQQMFGGTNVGEQEVSDTLQDKIATRRGVEAFRTPNIDEDFDPSQGNQILGASYTGEVLSSNCGRSGKSGIEGFRANSKDDKILDIALSIIIGILLIYVIYKFAIVKTLSATSSETQEEMQNDVEVVEIEE